MGKWEIWSGFRIPFRQRKRESFVLEPGGGDAHERAATLAHAYGFTVQQAAGVIAAFSPQTGWAENLRLAEDALYHARAGRTDLISGHTPNVCAKASRILQGEPPESVLGGRKVRSFYANILRPYRSGAVTIDRHAAALLHGERAHDRHAKALQRRGYYVACTAPFRSAARQLSAYTGPRTFLRPHEVQAIAWLRWRTLHNVHDHHNPHEEF